MEAGLLPRRAERPPIRSTAPSHRVCIKPPTIKKQSQGLEMKRLIFAGTLVLIATFAQAQNTASNPNSHPVQAYTTLGPAGAGVYRESPQRNNSATGNVVSHPRTIGTRKLRYE
jgi:hypothetical protein